MHSKSSFRIGLGQKQEEQEQQQQPGRKGRSSYPSGHDGGISAGGRATTNTGPGPRSPGHSLNGEAGAVGTDAPVNDPPVIAPPAKLGHRAGEKEWTEAEAPGSSGKLK